MKRGIYFNTEGKVSTYEAIIDISLWDEYLTPGQFMDAIE